MRTHLVAGGDLLIHAAVKRSARHAHSHDDHLTHDGFATPFIGIKDVVTAADLAFANLEVPIAPDVGRPLHGEVFNAPASLAPALAAIGFDVLSLANNHVFDQGPIGLVETVRRVTEAGMVPVGAGTSCSEAESHRVVEKNGMRIAFLAFSDLSNLDDRAGPDSPCAAFTGPLCTDACGADRDALHFTIDLPRLQARVRAARQEADAVVVSAHWQVEYRTAPLPEYRPVAQALVDAGADVILGHHPHVLQPVERLVAADGRSTVVAWSLGNLISDMGRSFVPGVSPVHRGDTRDGVLLRVELLAGAGVGTVEAVPTWTRNNHLTRGERPTRLEVVTHDYARSAPWPDELRLLGQRRARVAEIIGPQWLDPASRSDDQAP